MRTRIALVATIPVALSIITQAANGQPVHNTRNTSHHAAALTALAVSPNDSVAYRALTTGSEGANLHLPFQLDSGLLDARIVTSSGRSTPDTAAIAALVATPAKPGVLPVATPAPAAPVPSGPVDTVTPYEREAWEQVAMCEEGGNWQSDGSTFSGGLGISRANWDAYGGLQYAPEGAEATEDEQIMVAERIQSYPPDQDGCSGW
jgi:resuscitation-promoting factor RpfA